jgi:hypothetical protein
MNIKVLEKMLVDICRRQEAPDIESYLSVLEKINMTLAREGEDLRPRAPSGLPGGLVLLKLNIPTVIVPDLHARRGFFLNVLFHKDENGNTGLDRLASGAMQIVCVGDGFHAEKRGLKRWILAYEEYKKGYKHHINMDDEIMESLGLMEMVMEVKAAFPDNFHFLKGNHENIANETGGGNFAFAKYALEGAMVVSYMRKFYGDEFIAEYYRFEKNLPLLAVGRNFIVSHAEPANFFDKESIIEYRDNPEVVKGLTWTDNGAAEEGSVREMIDNYIKAGERDNAYYFGGHRPVPGLYNLRADNRYVQIHNPGKAIIAYIKDDKAIDLDNDILEIEDRTEEIIGEME